MSWSFRSSELTVAGDYTTTEVAGFDLPPTRGENIMIPLQAGRVHVEKFFDERILTLGIVIVGTDQTDLETNIDTLVALFGNRTRGYLVRTLPDASTRQALAEVVGKMNLTYHGPTMARATVDFLLAEPFFRSPNLENPEETIDETPHIYILNNPGTAEERKAIITLTGPLSHPTITNNDNGISLQYNDVISGGHYVEIDCEKFTTLYDGSTNVISKIVHTGDAAFMVLSAGDNNLSVVDGTHTTGTVMFEFYPPYLR